MANVTVELIQKLRERSGVGISDCKKALEQTDGDIEKAVDVLRQKGIAVAAKRSGNLTENGLVQGHKGKSHSALIEISCETDFSARTADMQDFAKSVAACAASDIDSSKIEDLMNCTSQNKAMSLQKHLDELIAKICENIKVSKAISVKNDEKTVSNIYIHPDNTVGTIIQISANRELNADEKTKLEDFCKDLCMQIAVTNPIAINSEEISTDTIARERENATIIAKQSGKPEQFWDKIIDGRLKKFFEEVCLLNQKFIKDESQTVEQKLQSISKDLKLESLKITKFSRIGIKR